MLMRVVVTGQVGMDKKPYLDAVAQAARDGGEPVTVHHVGEMMYAEAPDVPRGRILNLPLSRLQALRRSVMNAIIGRDDPGHTVINTHATFRWRHGLFSAFDFDQINRLGVDLFVCLVDNIEVVHRRLHDEHEIDATLKDCMVWREEEILATELMAQAAGGDFCIVSRGRERDNISTLARLILDPRAKRAYPSFPMSHVADLPETLAEIDAFRAEIALRFIAFDPGDVDEKMLLERAIVASRESRDFVEARMPTGTPFRVPVREILDIAGDIDGQIYMRDFKLIDQSDMIVSYIPELPGGAPGLSSGVERELQHAYEHGKDVYVIWKPAKSPSPFITETATRVFRTVDEALAHFDALSPAPKPHLFA
ncbi:MAG: AAA family ATPase [Planctomycetota bacterium]|nr:MAG: AAA family ATPase [Planctomycetota bacterium]